MYNDDYWSNVYNTPEKYGLEIVGEFDLAVPDYSFDMLVVFKERRGRYWIGEDSGCSCPSPFEDVKDINSLDGPYTKDGLRKRIEYRIEERGEDEDSYYTYSKARLRKSASDILSRIS